MSPWRCNPSNCLKLSDWLIELSEEEFGMILDKNLEIIEAEV